MPRKGAFGVLDVTAQRVVDADSLADFFGGGPDVLDLAAEDELLDAVFDHVVELVTVRAKKLEDYVVVRIVGGGNENTRVGPQTSGDIGHARSRQRPDQQNVH